jgi:hypothetical protein
MNTCILCSKKHHAKGYCYHHYWSYLMYGDACSARRKRGRPEVGISRGRVFIGVNELLISKWGDK